MAKGDMRKTLKILMIQTANMNLGDTVLADNDCYLLKKALHGKKCEVFRYSISSQDVGQIQYVDAVIFAGGIFKATNEKFWLYIPEIINEAQRLEVPVFFSAIGVEDFDPLDARSVALKEALNQPCVKGISVRDDIETLKRDYITNPEIRITPVYDPAIWCKDTYKEVLEEISAPGQVIGVGIVREQLFADYGHPEIDHQFQLDFWKGVIEELEKKGLPWKIFTNGDTYDEIMAEDVLHCVGHGEKLPAPRDGAKLVQDIAGFRGVIAGRMHSNIISYALGIPSVGFIWNQKLKFWGEKIQHSERFLSIEELTPQKAVEVLITAMQQKTKPKWSQKRTVYKAMKRFTDRWCRIRETKTEAIEYQETMMAGALGGIDVRYRNTNSKEAFQYSLECGYINYQVDLRLTSDDILVCVNRWHKDTYKMLGIEANDGEYQASLSLEEFQNARCYNRFHTMTFEEFMEMAVEHMIKKKIKIMISVGRPSEKQLKLILNQIVAAMYQYPIDPKKLLIRLERKKDVEIVRKANTGMHIVYHVVNHKKSPEETIAECRAAFEYCKSREIEYVSMSIELYTDEMAVVIQEYDLKVCVFTFVRTDRIIHAIKNGATYIGSHYYDVDYLSRLTH